MLVTAGSQYPWVAPYSSVSSVWHGSKMPTEPWTTQKPCSWRYHKSCSTSLIAVWIAQDPEATVLDVVGYAWAGFGAAFGPRVLIALYWEAGYRDGCQLVAT